MPYKMDDFHSLEDEIPFTDPTLKIVRREKWGALQPKIKEPIKLPAHRMFFTMTDTTRCMTKEECTKSVREIQEFYMNEKNMPDIPFSFLVGGDLRVYEGRGWGVKIREAAEPMEQPTWKTGRVVIGYITRSNDNSTHMSKMIQKAYDLMDYGIKRNYLVDFNKHNSGKEINIDDYAEFNKAIKEGHSTEKAPGFESEDSESSSGYVSFEVDDMEMKAKDIKPTDNDIFYEMDKESEKKRKEWEETNTYHDFENEMWRSSSDSDGDKSNKPQGRGRSDDKNSYKKTSLYKKYLRFMKKHLKKNESKNTEDIGKSEKEATTVLDEMIATVREMERCKEEIGEYSPNESEEESLNNTVDPFNIDSLRFPHAGADEKTKKYSSGIKYSHTPFTDCTSTSKPANSEEDRPESEPEKQEPPKDQETVLKEMYADAKEIERCKIEINEDSPNDTDDDYYRDIYKEITRRKDSRYKSFLDIYRRSL